LSCHSGIRMGVLHPPQYTADAAPAARQAGSRITIASSTCSRSARALASSRSAAHATPSEREPLSARVSFYRWLRREAGASKAAPTRRDAARPQLTSRCTASASQRIDSRTAHRDPKSYGDGDQTKGDGGGHKFGWWTSCARAGRRSVFVSRGVSIPFFTEPSRPRATSSTERRPSASLGRARLWRADCPRLRRGVQF
jgi:hypothetical protein